MKSGRKDPQRDEDPDMLPEYDFRGGVVGKYAERYAAGSNVAVLEPDVARAFPTSEAVNRALRSLMKRRKKKEQPPAEE